MVFWFCNFSEAKVYRESASYDPKSRCRRKTIRSQHEEQRDYRNKLSAFNLRLNNYTLENIFQSAKVFANGDPYPDLLNVLPKDAKRDERLHNSGNLKAFRYQNEDFPLIPKTVFYDFIYIAAVKNSFAADEIKEISSYNYFTDIEFNPAKSINTQARAAAMISLLLDEYGELPDFSKEDFIQYHKEHIVYDTLI